MAESQTYEDHGSIVGDKRTKNSMAAKDPALFQTIVGEE